MFVCVSFIKKNSLTFKATYAFKYALKCVYFKNSNNLPSNRSLREKKLNI